MPWPHLVHSSRKQSKPINTDQARATSREDWVEHVAEEGSEPVTTYLLDTNVILRFLTGEPEAQALRAKALFEQSEAGVLTIRILPLVIAEVVFVLTGKHYQMDRCRSR